MGTQVYVQCTLSHELRSRLKKGGSACLVRGKFIEDISHDTGEYALDFEHLHYLSVNFIVRETRGQCIDTLSPAAIKSFSIEMIGSPVTTTASSRNLAPLSKLADTVIQRELVHVYAEPEELRVKYRDVVRVGVTGQDDLPK